MASEHSTVVMTILSYNEVTLVIIYLTTVKSFQITLNERGRTIKELTVWANVFWSDFIAFNCKYIWCGLLFRDILKPFRLQWSTYLGLYSLSGRTSCRLRPRSRKIRVWSFPITLRYDKLIGSKAAEMPVKYQSDMNIIISNLLVSKLCEILR